MEITWLGILAVAILIFTGYGGYRKGFVREIMSFFFVFLALALAWMINRKPYVIPIPGSRKLERLVSNFDAGKIILSKQEVSYIDALLDGMTFDVFGGHR